MNEDIKREVERWKDALEEEFGPFDIADLSDGRCLLVPHQAAGKDEWQALYLEANRLIVDDYCPELFEDEPKEFVPDQEG